MNLCQTWQGFFFFYVRTMNHWKWCLFGRFSCFLHWMWQHSSPGFSPKPSLEFITNCRFPVISTCENIHRIPVHVVYTTFKLDMDFAKQNSPGFGRAWCVFSRIVEMMRILFLFFYFAYACLIFLFLVNVVNPALDYQPVQGVLCLSSCGSWNRLATQIKISRREWMDAFGFSLYIFCFWIVVYLFSCLYDP